jgi:hypothetical protein
MFTIKIPKKKERNTLVLAQAMRMAPKGHIHTSKRRKRDKHSWKKEQW